MSSKNYRYKHIYSAVEDKAPSASTLMTGEIAVNGNAEKPQLFIKDTSGDVRSFYTDYFQEVTQAQYDQMVEEGTIDERLMYIITDSDPIDVSKFVTSGSITSNTSAYTISFSGESGELFDVEFNKGGGLPLMEGTDIKIVSGDSYDTIYVSADTVIDSASTRVVQSKAIAEALDTKLDKVNFLNQIYPKGSIYITESNTNPSTFIGGTWELIGGEDADKNYYPAFAISTDTAGTTIDESLPNIKSGEFGNDTGGQGRGEVMSRGGAVNAAAYTGSSVQYPAPQGTSTGPRTFTFDASKGQVNADGTTYVPSTASTYQDGAQVNVNSIKLFFWKRTDDAPIAMMLEPVTLEKVEDVLWSGNTGSATISLSGSIDDYDQIEISVLADNTYNIVYILERDKLVNNTLIPVSWEGTNRHVHFTNVASTSLTFSVGNCRVTMVRGIKDAYVSRTDITTEINSGSTDDKAASAKAVYDAFAGIQFKNFAGSTNVSGSVGAAFNATINCEAGYEPLGIGSTSVSTGGSVGFGYILTITKLSDTSYKFSGWINPQGATTATVNAIFVKLPTRYLNQ